MCFVLFCVSFSFYFFKIFLMRLSSFGCKCIRYAVGVQGSSRAGGIPINKMGDQANENLSKQNTDRISLGNFSFELVFNLLRCFRV